MKLLLPSLFPQAPGKAANKEHMHITWLHTYKCIIRIDILATKGGSTKTEWPNKPLQSLRLLDRHRHIARLARTLFGLASEVSGGMFWGPRLPTVTNLQSNPLKQMWLFSLKWMRMNIQTHPHQQKDTQKVSKIKSHGKKTIICFPPKVYFSCKHWLVCRSFSDLNIPSMHISIPLEGGWWHWDPNLPSPSLSWVEIFDTHHPLPRQNHDDEIIVDGSEIPNNHLGWC